MGYDPILPDLWKHIYDSYVYDKRASVKPISKYVVDTLNQIGIECVEHHFSGKGAGAGISIDHSFSVHRSLKSKTNKLNPEDNLPCSKDELPALKAALECVLAGPYWPNDRVKSVRPEACSACERCREEDSALHQFWTCPCNNSIVDHRVSRAQDSVPLAVAEADNFPFLWLRGLLPADRLVVSVRHQPVATQHIT